MVPGQNHPVDPSRKRSGIALALALVTWIAALLAAIGPARATATVVEWPTHHPLLGPEPAGTPILLSERIAASIHLSVDCATLRPQREGTIVLATTRTPRRTEALLVTTSASGLEASVGDDPAVPLPLPPSGECRGELELRDDQATWRVDGRTRARATLGDPIVSGLFSDLARNLSLRVRLESRSQDSSPSGRQLVACLVAFVVGSVALTQVRGSSGHQTLTPPTRAGPADALVVATLFVWWIVGPTLSDDGWWQTLVRNQRSSGTFSYYYDQLNAPEIFGFAHHLLLAGMTAVSSNLLWLRLPALGFGIATWWLCRRMVQRHRADTAAATWVAATVFAVGWLASDMTLRPEPMIAWLTVVAATGMQRFRTSPAAHHLVGPALAAVVALTIHPVGLVAAAPMLAGLGSVVAFVRERRPDRLLQVTTVGVVALSAGILLLTADSDLARWRTTRAQVSESIGFAGIAGELERYRLLFTTAWGPPIRRAAFVIPVAAVMAVLLGKVAGKARRLRVGPETMSFVLALMLLAPSPTKWPNHLGALAGLAALAVAAHVARPSPWPITAASVTTAIILVLWPARVSEVWGPWMPLSPRLSDRAWMVFPALAVAGAGWWWRKRSGHDPVELWGVVAGAAIVVGVGVFLADGVVSSRSWSVARQNVGASQGVCGLAGAVTAVVDGRPTPLADLLGDSSRATLHDISLGPLLPCAEPPVISGGIAQVPDLVVRSRKGTEGALVNRLRDPFVMLYDVHDVTAVELSDPEHRFAPDLRVSRVERGRLRTFDPNR